MKDPLRLWVHRDQARWAQGRDRLDGNNSAELGARMTLEEIASQIQLNHKLSDECRADILFALTAQAMSDKRLRLTIKNLIAALEAAHMNNPPRYELTRYEQIIAEAKREVGDA